MTDNARMVSFPLNVMALMTKMVGFCPLIRESLLPGL